MSETIEFYVDSISVEKNVYHVTGVCDKGLIILGSPFSEVYKYIKGKDSKSLPLTKGKEFVRDIKLRVQQIKAYRRTLEELPEGMSGELWLIGEGEIYLQPKELLVGQG